MTISCAEFRSIELLNDYFNQHRNFTIISIETIRWTGESDTYKAWFKCARMFAP